MTKLESFIELAKQFKAHGFNLFLVGGTVRDYLLHKELSDMDAVTDATPDEVISFLSNVDTTFAKLGSLKYKNSEGLHFDITTLRKESNYLDARHPSKITFVKTLDEDYIRRDFTINALYMDMNLRVYDYCDAQKDLNNKVIRMIGDPDTRIKEDPLRILRAIRFSLVFDFDIEPNLYQTLKDRFYLLDKITPAKVESEFKKLDSMIVNQKRKTTLYKEFDIANLKGVVK